MEPFRARWRRAAVAACVALLAAFGLGLAAPAPAGASCAGPQLALEQAGAVLLPRRVGAGDRERILRDVRRDAPLRVEGSNLTFGCQDTYATRPGCGAPTPVSAEPIVPMRDPELVLTQGGRTWRLGPMDPIAPDLTARVEVDLPRAARRGAAVLSVLDASGVGPELELVLR